MIKAICISVAAMGLAVISGLHALGVVAESKNPPLAQYAFPTNGLAKTELASLQFKLAVVQNGSQLPEKLPPEIRDLALAGYIAEPTDPEAIRILAQYSESWGNKERARTLMRLIPSLSKRDKVANLWLARDFGELQRTDEALAIYDTALRASSSVVEQLMPQMVASMADPRLVEPYSVLLDRDPPWAPQFWQRLIDNDAALANTGKLRELVAVKGMALSAKQDRALVRRLADKGHLNEALSLFRKLDPGNSGRGILANRDFKRQPEFAPFDWELFSTGYFGASIDPSAGRMAISAVPGSSGVAARQLVRLPAGTYRLSATLRSALPRDSKLAIVIRCAENGSNAARRFLISGTALDQQVSTDGVCSFHWLELAIAIPSDGTPTDLLVEQIRLSSL